MKALIVILAIALLACGHKPEYIEVGNTIYDIPIKSQVSICLVLKDSIMKKNVTDILNKEFRWAMDRSMKYNNPPSHIFIYLYADTVDWQKRGAAWLGMKKRVMNVDSPIDLSETLKR